MQDTLMQIAPLRPIDIEAAFRLSYTEGWNQTKADWLRLLEYQPKGCFGAYCDGGLVGTVTTSVYGELAWLGMMLVQREYRGLGLGRRLMLAALEYARTEGVATVKLDATPAGRTLYQALDFVPEAGIERWERSGASPGVGTNSLAIEEMLLSDITRIDRVAFGADRSAMLSALSRQSCAQPLIARNPDGGACGYAMARPGSRAVYIGPIISIDPHQTAGLLDEMVGQFAGEAIFIDFCKSSAIDSSLLSSRDFAKQRDLTRMYWGKQSSAGLSSSICSISGPEIG